MGVAHFLRTCILMELPSGAMISYKHLIGAIQKRLGTEMHSVVTAKTSTAVNVVTAMVLMVELQR